jgi:hypothetical protein
VVVYRDHDGKQRKETARTLDDARALKRRREGGETNAAGRLTFAEYARDWITRHPVRDSTRSDYKAHLEGWLIPFIGEKRKLADVSPLLVNPARRAPADCQGPPRRRPRRFDDRDDPQAASGLYGAGCARGVDSRTTRRAICG